MPRYCGCGCGLKLPKIRKRWINKIHRDGYYKVNGRESGLPVLVKKDIRPFHIFTLCLDCVKYYQGHEVAAIDRTGFRTIGEFKGCMGTKEYKSDGSCFKRG